MMFFPAIVVDRSPLGSTGKAKPFSGLFSPRVLLISLKIVLLGKMVKSVRMITNLKAHK